MERVKDSRMDPLTGMYYNWAFFVEADAWLREAGDEPYCMVAVDIEHFRLFNELYGRRKGDRLLLYMAECIKKIETTYGGIGGYLGGDNFCILMPRRMELIKELKDEISEGTAKMSGSVGFLPAFGVYNIEDMGMQSITMYDRATIALSHINGVYVKRICEFDASMVEKLEEEMFLLSEVQKALENDEFTFYAQPQCDITTGKIVGAESLVRWNHHSKGLVSPGYFIPPLEKNGFIADLDKHVWRKVCMWLRQWEDRGYTPVPISINVSRIDIFSMNVPAYLHSLIEEFELKPKYLKVEITESAYAENNDQIVRTIKELEEMGFLVMMDDFGSGYSSLNMLKSIEVDVLKIDMKFLDIDENEKEKGIGILESVVNMSRQLGVPVIVEGVETKKQEEFLSSMGCRYVQGYYYYRPLPIAEFEKVLSDEKQLDFDGFWCRQMEALHARELFDSNLFSDTMLNSILGATAFYDIYENTIEITKANMQYCELTGIFSGREERGKKFWDHVFDDDRRHLLALFDEAYTKPLDGASGYVRFQREDGRMLWIFIRIFFLRERGEHKSFYSSLTDVTEIHEKTRKSAMEGQLINDLSENQMRKMEELYGNFPCAFGVTKILLNEKNEPKDYEIVYGNREMDRICGNSIKRLRVLMRKVLSEDYDEILQKAFRAAYDGDTSDYYVYSSVSNRYLQFTFYQYQYGYVGCLLRDVTHNQMHEDALRTTMKFYREVYFLQLETGYYCMVYPDENFVLERGSYREFLHRHLGNGTIDSSDTEGLRRFLAPEEIRSALAEQDMTEWRFREIKDGKEEWFLASVMVCEREKGVPKTAFLTIRSIDELVNGEKKWQQEHVMELLTTMSEGFFIYRAEEDEKILFANPTLIRLFGCKDIYEFRELTGNSFRGMIHPDDVERVEGEIKKQIRGTGKNIDYTEYRIVRKDGEVRKVCDWGHMEGSEEGNYLFYVIIRDITEETE